MKTLCQSFIVCVLTLLCQYENATGQTAPSALQNSGTQQVKTLGEVNVRAQKPVIRQEADRIIYDLQADPDSRSKSVLEMMRKIPFLSLDASNNMLLKGNSSYKIFINGKPSGMLTHNPKEVLGSMPASSIKEIEVITTPPAKYDAEGLAGIINIILVKKTTDGINGVINLSEKFPQGGPGVGGSFAARQGRLGIAVFGGGSMNNTPAINIDNYRNTITEQPTSFVQQGQDKTKSRAGYLGTEISYEIDSLHLVFASFSTNMNQGDADNNRHSALMSEGALVEGYVFFNDSRNKTYNIEAGINYQSGFKADKNRLLTFSYNYSNNNNDLTNNVSIINRVNYVLPGYRQFNDGKASEQTVQIDYVHPLKKLLIEAGVKGIFRINKSDYQHYNLDEVSKSFELDSSASNQFDNHQNVFSIYNSYNFTAKKWSVKAGVRLEQTATDVDFISTRSKVRQRFLHLIPAVAVGYRIDNSNSLNFGFTRRIKRPGIHKLNPYVNRANPNYESMGNPNLAPSLMNNLTLGYGKSGKFNINVGLGYSFFNNLDLGITTFDSTRNVMVATFANVGKGDAILGYISLGYPVIKNWNLGLNTNLTYVKLEGESDGAIMRTNSLLYNINLSSSHKFDKGWRFMVNVTAIGPNIVSLQAISNRVITSSFTLSKELLGGNIALSATVNNPFSTYRNNRVATTGKSFYESSLSREYFRNFSLSADIRLGQLKGGIKKTKRGINNNDVSNKGGL
ncbi:outer membrane beta-barrel family protein [Chitinophaga defluvii]|uniref:Outer membrane beta-barrel protein n=1 Tax=Chitinophaga defluvii TaxID=3163343 RepID=A0ABV2T3E2_9BACT